MARVPAPPPGDPPRRRRGAGGPSAGAGFDAPPRESHRGRGLPDRGQTPRRPGLVVAGVRARALGTAVEAARREPRRFG